MRLRLSILLLIATSSIGTLPLSAAPGVDGEGYVNAGESGGNTSDPEEGPNEPANDECTGAVALPVLTRGRTDDRLGPAKNDPADWFAVQLYRTEGVTFAATSTGAAKPRYAETCEDEPAAGSLLHVSANQMYPLRVAENTFATAYTLTYDIFADDAGTGKDVPNFAEGAHPIDALPHSDSTDPTDQLTQAIWTGSLPSRPDQSERDVDWFRIGTTLAHDPIRSDGNFSLGLLRVKFTPDCDTAALFQLTLFDHGRAEIAPPSWGCGLLAQSCVAAGFSAVYAKSEIVSHSSGGGYNFSADLSPVYLVDLDTGQYTLPETTQPWCDPITPRLLALLGEDLGVVDSDGQVVAKVTTDLP